MKAHSKSDTWTINAWKKGFGIGTKSSADIPNNLHIIDFQLMVIFFRAKFLEWLRFFSVFVDLAAWRGVVCFDMLGKCVTRVPPMRLASIYGLQFHDLKKNFVNTKHHSNCGVRDGMRDVCTFTSNRTIFRCANQKCVLRLMEHAMQFNVNWVMNWKWAQRTNEKLFNALHISAEDEEAQQPYFSI